MAPHPGKAKANPEALTPHRLSVSCPGTAPGVEKRCAVRYVVQLSTTWLTHGTNNLVPTGAGPGVVLHEAPVWGAWEKDRSISYKDTNRNQLGAHQAWSDGEGSESGGAQ
jgi:hypothetical protein